MTYEAWRISYQSSEQAARAAYAECARLRAKIEEMERQEPARLVTPTAYRWRYRGAVKWQYGELTEETARVAKEHNHEVQPLYDTPGAQPAPSVPEGWQLVPTAESRHPGIYKMLGALHAADNTPGMSEWESYRAMLAAAPETKP